VGTEGNSVRGWIEDGFKGAVGGAVGFLVTGALALAVSALTGGSIVHLMGGLTKEDAFGGLFFKPEHPFPGYDQNPLNSNHSGCVSGFDAVELGKLTSAEPRAQAGYVAVFLCVPAKKQ
jgi:hypothetical protein